MSCAARQCGQSTFIVPAHAACRLFASVSMPVEALCRVFGQMKNNEAIAISRIANGLSATGARAHAAAGDHRKLAMAGSLRQWRPLRTAHKLSSLVSRFRRSHPFAARARTNVGPKGHQQLYDPSVALDLTFL